MAISALYQTVYNILTYNYYNLQVSLYLRKKAQILEKGPNKKISNARYLTFLENF